MSCRPTRSVQVTLARRILALWGCLGRLHFRLPSSEVWKLPLYSNGVAWSVPHSIYLAQLRTDPPGQERPMAMHWFQVNKRSSHPLRSDG
jgi:hypothetical protein